MAQPNTNKKIVGLAAMTWAQRILSFQKNLRIETALPLGVDVLNPYQNKNSFHLGEKFYTKFYNDQLPRQLILGINPGRLGGGITGIPFIDPVKLERLNIANDLPKKRELSSDFIDQLMERFGGVEKFYKTFYFSSVVPLGFTKDKKNLNYYDDKNLAQSLRPFIISSLATQMSWGIDRTKCFCLGEGKNFKFIQQLNRENHFFEEIIPLPHPRFIMQYRRKKMDEYLTLYMRCLKS